LAGGNNVTRRSITEPTRDEYGDEVHPSWVLIGASRGSWSPPGVALFQSEIRHQHAVTIRVVQASRKRDLKHDWVHGGKILMEVVLSEAQWASFVSSMNSGDGTPATLTLKETDYNVPQAPYDPRFAVTMAEASGAAADAFKDVQEALAEYERLVAEKAPAKDRKRAYQTLQSRIRNAGPNVEYAGKRLAEHAEDVVNRARADIEAFVTKKAAQLGIDPGELGTFSLLSGDTPREVEA
jgi:hypothetical protein